MSSTRSTRQRSERQSRSSSRDPKDTVPDDVVADPLEDEGEPLSLAEELAEEKTDRKVELLTMSIKKQRKRKRLVQDDKPLKLRSKRKPRVSMQRSSVSRIRDSQARL